MATQQTARLERVPRDHPGAIGYRLFWRACGSPEWVRAPYAAGMRPIYEGQGLVLVEARPGQEPDVYGVWREE